MLKDPKVKALTENFAAQWLQLRTLQTIAPDKKTYANYDADLKTAMARETELYFEHIVKEDGSILEFLDSNYTFLERSARETLRHQGCQGQRVSQGDVDRCEPWRHCDSGQHLDADFQPDPDFAGQVRGNGFSTISSEHPPPPPDPNAAMLKKKINNWRRRGRCDKGWEQHRANPSCATCHQKMDPLGFGLENFDGVGTWRTKEGTFNIDSSGTLPGGKQFNGPAELRKILLGKADLFRHCLAEKNAYLCMGRGVEYYDKCAIDDMVSRVQKHDDRFSAMILSVVQSDPFLKRRGK